MAGEGAGVSHPGDELLILEHTDEFPDAGVQVPAGGVQQGELPEAAAMRELFEETGLRSADPPVYLESHLWADPKAPSRIRHYYWTTAGTGTPDVWSHVVSAGEDDRGLVFRLSFRALAAPALTPGYGWEAGLPRLSTVMNRSHRRAE